MARSVPGHATGLPVGAHRAVNPLGSGGRAVRVSIGRSCRPAESDLAARGEGQGSGGVPV
jgi:hypothetical protein